MTFFDQYISTRHPNSPRKPPTTPREAAASQSLAEAARSMVDHLNALYCLREGIIQPADLPVDWMAI